MINSTIILYFWFKECNPNMWCKKNQEFDNLIKNKFQKTLDHSLVMKKLLSYQKLQLKKIFLSLMRITIIVFF